MAILQALKASSATEQMPGIGDGQSAKTIASTYSWTAAPALNDIIQSGLIQSGSVIVDVWIAHSGFGTSATLEVGYGGDTDYFITSGTSVTGGVIRGNAATMATPLLLTANDTIDVKINAAGANATGTVTIYVQFLPRSA